MKQNPYSFFEKWDCDEPIPMDDIYKRLSELEIKVKNLEKENIGLTNALYEIENSLDARIDNLANKSLNKFDLDDK